MKRDLLLLSLCLCLLTAIGVSAGQIVPAVSSGGVSHGQWTLILDAGHGGEDGGAVTAGGDRESEINLSIVLKTEYLMAFLGVETKLTRDQDVSLSTEGNTVHERKVSDLKNRVTMISETQNAILISVHQNYFTDSRYSGAQVFYGQGDLCRQWGEYTQEVLRRVLDETNDRAAKLLSGDLYLFSHISCPVILVECGFLSNGEEASLLMTDQYQRKVALALAGAYLHQLEMMPTIKLSGGN